jgi:hypothetical protein
MYSRILFAALILTMSCDSQPKVIVADEKSSNASQSVAPDIQKQENEEISDDLHQVKALEILNTDKYTYVNVSEKNEKFWIAVSKQKIIEGHTYYFRGGLKKSNFYSKEFDRTFDVVYLVSSIIDSEAHPGGSLENSVINENTTIVESKAKSNEQKIEGAIEIKDILKNANKFKDKKIIVSGVCVKANYQIMNRNWYHIQDNNKNDLTITSSDQIKVGDNVAFEGIVAVDKDFGAGYRYKVIVEDSKVKN